MYTLPELCCLPGKSARVFYLLQGSNLIIVWHLLVLLSGRPSISDEVQFGRVVFQSSSLSSCLIINFFCLTFFLYPTANLSFFLPGKLPNCLLT